MTEKRAVVEAGWIVCPKCGKRQFPIGNAVIRDLEWKCRWSRCKEYFIVDFPCNSGRHMVE